MSSDFESKEKKLENAEKMVEWFREHLIKEQQKAQVRYDEIQKLEGKILIQRLLLLMLSGIILIMLFI